MFLGMVLHPRPLTRKPSRGKRGIKKTRSVIALAA
jgi:hypothetical protein